MAHANRNVKLYVNALDKSIMANNITKVFPNDEWTLKILPIIYPIWDSDRDRLETFAYFQDGDAFMTKNKYRKNAKTGEYVWESYEFDLEEFSTAEITELYTKLYDQFLQFKEKQDFDLDSLIKSEYVKNNVINWNKVRLIRNFLLDDSDWSQLPDAALTDTEKAQWVTYRTELRNLPELNNGREPMQCKFPVSPDYFKRMTTEEEYLSTDEHRFVLTQTAYRKYVKRMVAYMTISLSATGIETMGVKFLRDPYSAPDDILDTLLTAIEDGDI